MTVEAANPGPPFCPECGSIFKLPNVDPISCSYCSFETTYRELQLPTVITVSAPRPVPSWAAEKKNDDAGTGMARMVSEERCPKCDHPELLYYTMQLRSADEGQTVFYECSECNHKFSVNN